MPNQIKATASSVLIKPISKTKNTFRGKIISIGTSGAISVGFQDIVYYSEEDIISTLNIPYEVHALFYYKIFAVEENMDNSTKVDNKNVMFNFEEDIML